MSVTVVVPVRIRLDPAAYAADAGCLGDAVEAATTRALAQARKEVFEPRGGYAPPSFGEPTITYYGAGLGSIDASTRDGIDRAIRDAIARAAEGAQLDVGAAARNAAPEVLLRGEAAPFDPERQTPGDTSYIVDSYGSESREPDQTPIANLSRGQAKTTPPARGHAVRLISSGHSVAEIMEAGGDYLLHMVKTRLAGSFGGLTPIGVIFRSKTDGYNYFSIFRVRLKGEELEFEDRLLYSQTIKVRGLEQGEVRATSVTAEGDLVLISELVPGIVNSRDALIKHTAHYFESKKTLDDIYQHLMHDKPVTSKQRRLFKAYRDAGKEALYLDYAALLIEGFQDPVPCRLYQVENGESIFLLNADAPSIKWLPVIPLLEDAGEAHKAPPMAVPGTPAGDQTEPGQDEQGACWGKDAVAPYSADGAESEEIYTGPFECEPPVESFGAYGESMMATMAEIAEKLHMTDRAWDFAGAFAINAARVMHGRAAIALNRAVGDLAQIKPAPFGKGNAGDAEVSVSKSPAMALLCELASVAPLLEKLDRQILEVMGSDLLPKSWLRNYSAGWKLHYRDKFMEAVRWAVYAIFTEACRVAMLQLLGASGAGIKWIDKNFDAYFDVTKKLLSGAVRRISELRRMREHILQAEALNFAGNLAGGPAYFFSKGKADPKVKHRSGWEEIKAGGSATVRVGYQYWRDAREWWRDDGKLDTVSRAMEEVAAREAVEGTIERQPDGTYAVIEMIGTERHVWTRAALEEAIKNAEGMASFVDPLVKHMTNLEGSVAAFRTEYGARDFLRKLINRMLEGNAKAIVEVRADRMFAFRTAKITENEKTGRVGTAGVDMQNIHRMANDAIAESFGGGWMYGEGLKFLFVSEKGREEILPVLELVVTIGAFALFAPLGYALSATAAAIRYDTAAGHEALTAGLIDPDQIMSQAEAELEMFMSHFEIALLVIPEAGTIAKKVAQGGSTLFRKGVREGSKALIKQATSHMLEEFATALKGELLKSFVHQLITAKMLEPVLQQALGPVFAELQSEAQFGNIAGDPAGLSDQLKMLAEYGDVAIEMEPVERLEDRP